VYEVICALWSKRYAVVGLGGIVCQILIDLNSFVLLDRIRSAHSQLVSNYPPGSYLLSSRDLLKVHVCDIFCITELALAV